jgi:hypothetical protein
VSSEREREEVQSKLRRLSVSEEFINGQKEARKENQDLLNRLRDIDLSSMSPKQRMRYEIEKQIGNED